MKKLHVSWLILVPLVGCSGAVGDDSGLSDGVTFGGAGNVAGATSSFAGATGFAGTSGAGSTAAAGAPGVAGTGGSPFGSPGGAASVGGSGTAGSNGGACSAAVLPAALQTMLANKCGTCHGATPLPNLPALASYANLTAPSAGDPSKTNAVVALARMQSKTMPMPPSPATPATAAEISTLQDFINQGYPKPSCPTGGGGAGSGGSGGSGNGGAGGSAAGAANDPLSAMPKCSSNSTWNNGNRGSASMNPGMACITCHKSGEGPNFSIAGTVYPTGHEPDKCNSTVGTAGARIVIIGADGKSTTLTPNNVGNFTSNAAIKTPYQAKVTYQGRERVMVSSQTSGDCNSCHTQNGANKAPGRITVP